MNHFIAIFANTYNRPKSWVIIMFAILNSIFAYVGLGWWGVLAVLFVWLTVAPCAIWLVDHNF